ncbi:MAG: NUDIX hydrolase [Nanoarchaeota archaeon]|nr:NUDIX hydrolase [Nanoarchaeota archaeon]
MPEIVNKNIKNVDAATGIILRPSAKRDSLYEVLLQKKDIGYPWFPGEICLFGGGIELGEEPKKAFLREVSEELSIKLNNLNFFRKFPYQDTNTKGEIRGGYSFVHSAEFTGNMADIRLTEGGGYLFIHPSEFHKFPIVKHDLDILQTFFREKFNYNF